MRGWAEPRRHPRRDPNGAPSHIRDCSFAPTIPPVAPLYPFFPPGTHTGVADLDRVIDGAVGDDAAALRSLVLLSRVPCDQTRADYRRPPDCPPGVAAGTLVDVLPTGDCEGSFRRAAGVDDALAAYLAAGPLLYGVALQPAAAGASEAGTFAIVFTSSAPTMPAIVLTVKAGRIIAAEHGCGKSPPDSLFGFAGVGYGTATGSGTVFGPPPWTIELGGRRTGTTTVDAALAVLVTGDPKLVEPLVALSMFPCTSGQRGVGSPPACPPGTRDGTPLLEFMAARGCEGYFVPPALVGREVARALATAKALAAVYTHPAGPLLSPPYFPASEYEVLFEQFGGQAISFHLDGHGQLVFVAERCAATPSTVLRDTRATDLLR